MRLRLLLTVTDNPIRMKVTVPVSRCSRTPTNCATSPGAFDSDSTYKERIMNIFTSIVDKAYPKQRSNRREQQNYSQIKICPASQTRMSSSSSKSLNILLSYLERVDVVDGEHRRGDINGQTQPADDNDENRQDEEVKMVTATLKERRSISRDRSVEEGQYVDNCKQYSHVFLSIAKLIENC